MFPRSLILWCSCVPQRIIISIPPTQFMLAYVYWIVMNIHQGNCEVTCTVIIHTFSEM